MATTINNGRFLVYNNNVPHRLDTNYWSTRCRQWQCSRQSFLSELLQIRPGLKLYRKINICYYLLEYTPVLLLSL